MEKILYLEKRGCNFFKGDRANKLSDIGNYRVCTPSANVEGKDGRMYFLEFTHYDKKRVRDYNLRTGAPLKKRIVEVTCENALGINTQFNEKINGIDGAWRNVTMEKELDKMDFRYTKYDILTVVNMISVDTYVDIEFVNDVVS